MSHLLLHLSWIAAFVTAALLIGSQAFSQVTDPSQPAEPITLPTEVISATRYERPLSGLPLSATVITREDILNSPGRTIDESLRNVAGVQLPFDNADVIFPLHTVNRHARHRCWRHRHALFGVGQRNTHQRRILWQSILESGAQACD